MGVVHRARTRFTDEGDIDMVIGEVTRPCVRFQRCAEHHVLLAFKLLQRGVELMLLNKQQQNAIGTF